MNFIETFKNTFFTEHLRATASKHFKCEFHRSVLSIVPRNIFNPFQPSVVVHIETSHLLFALQKKMTGLYMKHSPGLKWLKRETLNAYFIKITKPSLINQMNNGV